MQFFIRFCALLTFVLFGNLQASFWDIFCCMNESTPKESEVAKLIKTMQSSTDIEDFTKKVHAQCLYFPRQQRQEMQQEREKLLQELQECKNSDCIKALPKKYEILLQDNDKQVNMVVNLLEELHVVIPYQQRECQWEQQEYYKKMYGEKFQKQSSVYDDYEYATLHVGSAMHRLDIFDRERAYHNAVQDIREQQIKICNDFIRNTYEQDFYERLYNFNQTQLQRITTLKSKIRNKSRCVVDSQEVYFKKCRADCIKYGGCSNIPEFANEKFNRYLDRQEKLKKYGLDADEQFYQKVKAKHFCPLCNFDKKYPYPSKNGVSRCARSARCMDPWILCTEKQRKRNPQYFTLPNRSSLLLDVRLQSKALKRQEDRLSGDSPSARCMIFWLMAEKKEKNRIALLVLEKSINKIIFPKS